MRRLFSVRLLPCLLVIALCSPERSLAASIDVSGAPGVAGTAGAAGNPGQTGGAGGDGEPATASSTSADPIDSATATAGAGGIGGAGGDGVPAGASAGNGGAGGAGGTAAASSSSSTTVNDPFAFSQGDGGTGGAGGIGGVASAGGAPGAAGAGGAGGAASSQASAVSSMGSFSHAQAGAYGGAGGTSPGTGGIGGTATASAYARSDTGRAIATVFQQGGDGGAGGVTAGRGQDSVLVNAAKGDAAMSLELDQYATGGAGGEGPGSRGGDARSEFSTESRGTSLLLSASAWGGDASSPDGGPTGGAQGGSATVIVDAVDHVGIPVYVDGAAHGGNAYGPNGQVGQTSLSVHAASTSGGDVSASGGAVGGDGAVGGSVDLVDAVTGKTTGSLHLFQRADGGSGSEVAGTASSRLRHTGSLGALDVVSEARGGSAMDPEAGFSQADGASGYAEAEADNDIGSAHAKVEAGGGDGSHGLASSAGAGEARATATTEGDGHSAAADSFAEGGLAYHDLGLPGVAHSVSVATARGNGTATATSTAVGGAVLVGGLPIAGAYALAEATASGAGAADVVARANATGGRGLISIPSIPLGPAHARAFASGLGLVGATATALGDATSSVQSEARSTGSVLASRAALTTLGPQHAIDVPIGTDASFRAPSTQARADALTSKGYNTYALVNAAPTSSDAVSWVASSPAVLDSVVHASQIHALGRFAVVDGASGSLSLDLDGAAVPADDLLVGFVNPHAPLAGFDALDVQISFAGSVVWDQSFDTASEAQAALSGTLVAIDAGSIPSGSATLVVSWVFDDGTSDSSFSSDFVVFSGSGTPVPEPGAPALLVLALAALALIGYARSQSSRI